jgi:hypothetical protein
VRRNEKELLVENTVKMQRALTQIAAGNASEGTTEKSNNNADLASNFSAAIKERDAISLRGSMDQERGSFGFGMKKSKSKEKDINVNFAREVETVVGVGGGSGGGGSGKKGRERSPDSSQTSNVRKNRELSPENSTNSGGPDDRVETVASPTGETKFSLFVDQLKLKKSKSRDKMPGTPDSPRRRDSSIVLSGRERGNEREGRTRESLDGTSAVTKTDGGGFRDSPPLTPQHAGKHTTITESLPRVSPRGEKDREGRLDSAREREQAEGQRSARGETRSPRKSVSRDDLRSGVTIDGFTSANTVHTTNSPATGQHAQSPFPARSPRARTEFENSVKERKDRELRSVASESSPKHSSVDSGDQSPLNASTTTASSTATPSNVSLSSSNSPAPTSGVSTPRSQSRERAKDITVISAVPPALTRSRRNSLSNGEGSPATSITIEDSALVSSTSISKSQRSRKFSLSLQLDSHNLPVILRESSPRRKEKEKEREKERDAGEMSVYQALESPGNRKSKKSDSPKYTPPKISPASNPNSAGDIDEDMMPSSQSGTPRRSSKTHRERESGHRRTSSTDTPALQHHESAPKLLQTKKKRTVSPRSKEGSSSNHPSSGDNDAEMDSDEDNLDEGDISFTAPQRLSHSLTSATAKASRAHDSQHMVLMKSLNTHLIAAGGGASSRGQTPESSPDRCPHVQFADEAKEVINLNHSNSNIAPTTQATEVDDRDQERARERGRGISSERGRKKTKLRANSADPRYGFGFGFGNENRVYIYTFIYIFLLLF